jgi:hypothetical protein
MAMVFGAATSNLIAVNGLTDVQWWNTNKYSLFTAWLFPTTLTAGRSIARAGTIAGITIHTVTSSLRFTGDAATDGVWTWPAGLATNTWSFVACAVNVGATPTAAVRAWSATPTSGPVEQTVTVTTAPVGAWTSSGVNFTIGNTTSSSTTAFQGQIGGLTYFCDGQNNNSNSLGAPADGTIPQAAADHLLRNFVTPLWRGDVAQFGGFGRYVRPPGVGIAAPGGYQFHVPLEGVVASATTAYRNTGPAQLVVTAATQGMVTPRGALLVQDNQRHPKGVGGGIPARG